jgi:hypothetical protein
MTEAYQGLSPDDQRFIVVALRNWAAQLADPSQPILRFLDGAALTGQDLLDEDPDLEFVGSVRTEMSRDEAGGTRNRAWRHLLNLVAVSMENGEDLDELLRDFGAGPRGEKS